MKSLKVHLLTVTAILIFTSNTWSQKIYKSSSHVRFYSGILSPEEKPVETSLHQVFSSNNEVTGIDFSGTGIMSPSALYRQSIQSVLKRAEFFGIPNKGAMKTIMQQKPESLTMVIPFNNRKITIDLIKATIFGDEFKVLTDKNPYGESVELGVYYRGVVRGEKSVVSISFFPTHTEGLINIAGKPVIEFGKMQNSGADDVHVIYSDDELLQKQSFVCSTKEPSPEYLQQMKTIPRISLSQESTASMKCVTEFWETSYNVYQKFGTKQAVTDFITTLFNSFAAIYANENIGMKLNSTFIWTSADPYANDLSTFSNKRTNFGANLATLISTTGGGGVAWLDILCQSNDYYKHAFCGSITNAGSILPAYSWPVNVTTHETGHNLASPHTHACVWNGNSTAIDGCGPAAGYSEGCKGPIPNNGTIMSYCHLLSGVGINLSLGFGTQPGNLIRGRVNNCITLTCSAVASVCNPPSNVTVSNVASKAVTISWSVVSGANYYYIHISDDNGATWKRVANNLTIASHRIKYLTPKTKYLCKVGASCISGKALSSAVTFTTLSAISAITEPSSISAEFINGNNSIKVLPNPAKGGKFMVTLANGMENATVEIINNMGQPVASNNNKGLNRSFKVSSAKGLYFVKVINGSQLFTTKVIVE